MNPSVDSCGQVADVAFLLRQIAVEPLRYLHARRPRPRGNCLSVRQRAIINRNLVASLPALSNDGALTARQMRVIFCWRQVPLICALAGAQTLKSSLAYRGSWLHLPLPVRSFLALPMLASGARHRNNRDAQAWLRAFNGDPLLCAQAEGLRILLAWAGIACPGMIGRLRLMFAPEMDACCESAGGRSLAAEIVVIEQAIHYAKSYSYRMSDIAGARRSDSQHLPEEQPQGDLFAG